MQPAATSLRHFDNLELDTHIRVLIQDGQPLFVAKDICANLELGNTGQALVGLDDDEKVTLTSSNVINSDLRLPNRGLQFVTESGLYALIFKSRKEAARKFRKWVTSEVLPAIRREGKFDPASLPDDLAPSVRAAAIMAEVAVLENRAMYLRAHFASAQVIDGQMTVWQWLTVNGHPIPEPVHIGQLSMKCRRLAAERGITTGAVKYIDLPDRRVRICRTALTFPPDLLAEVLQAK